jgi:hypothetical protein
LEANQVNPGIQAHEPLKERVEGTVKLMEEQLIWQLKLVELNP